MLVLHEKSKYWYQQIYSCRGNTLSQLHQFLLVYHYLLLPQVTNYYANKNGGRKNDSIITKAAVRSLPNINKRFNNLKEQCFPGSVKKRSRASGSSAGTGASNAGSTSADNDEESGTLDGNTAKTAIEIDDDEIESLEEYPLDGVKLSGRELKRLKSFWGRIRFSKPRIEEDEGSEDEFDDTVTANSSNVGTVTAAEVPVVSQETVTEVPTVADVPTRKSNRTVKRNERYKEQLEMFCCKFII